MLVKTSFLGGPEKLSKSSIDFALLLTWNQKSLKLLGFSKLLCDFWLLGSWVHPGEYASSGLYLIHYDFLPFHCSLLPVCLKLKLPFLSLELFSTNFGFDFKCLVFYSSKLLTLECTPMTQCFDFH